MIISGAVLPTFAIVPARNEQGSIAKVLKDLPATHNNESK